MTFHTIFTFTNIYLRVPILIKVRQKQRGFHIKTSTVHVVIRVQTATYLQQ